MILLHDACGVMSNETVADRQFYITSNRFQRLKCAESFNKCESITQRNTARKQIASKSRRQETNNNYNSHFNKKFGRKANECLSQRQRLDKKIVSSRTQNANFAAVSSVHAFSSHFNAYGLIQLGGARAHSNKIDSSRIFQMKHDEKAYTKQTMEIR